MGPVSTDKVGGAIIIGLVFFLVTCVCDADAEQKTGVAALAGIWVPESTISKLTETMSPISSSPEMITISKGADRRWKLSWTNFHEGSWRIILNFNQGANSLKKAVLRLSMWESLSPDNTRDGEMLVDMSFDKAGSVPSAVFAGASFIEHRGERFVKVPEGFATYANQLLLQGKWHDGRRRSYVFTADCMAKWPDVSFQYEISMDSSEAGCDYIKIRATGEPGGYKRYGFARSKDSLSLFEILYDQPVPISCEDKPFAVLKRDN